MEYLDFDLQVGLLENGQYPVSVRSPAGEASDRFIFPYTEWQLKDKLKDLELALRASPHLRRALPPELQSVQEMGRDFFNLLLPGELRARFDVSQRMAFEQGKGLRVRLRIQSPELGALPWEYLYDPRQGEYLCLSAYTPIIRYLDLPQPILPLEITPPLRVLGMACSPTNLAELDVDQEKRRIEEALAPLQRDGLVTLQWLAGSTWRDLQQALSAAEHAGTGWHIFHSL